MQFQEDAWNSYQLEDFMSCYWENDSLCFIGKSGLNRGWQKTLDNYKKSYPDTAAMGHLKFENIEFLPLSPAHAYVIGKWSLFRVEDTLSGHYSLLWQKKQEGWKIIADHSS
jgi:ketosteroid isomerase-like protein